MELKVEDQLFVTDSMATEPPQAAERAPVDETFRCYDQEQSFPMPLSLADWLPEDHLARFVSELVDEVLDLTAFLASCTEARGYPPYDPRLMLKILLCGYTTGVRSSRTETRRALGLTCYASELATTFHLATAAHSGNGRRPG